MKATKAIIGYNHAFEGLIYTAKTQLNFKIHLLVGIVVLMAGKFLGISRFEWFILLQTIALVIIAELVNTAVESVTDLITIKFSHHAKVAKDVAAAAVLVSAIYAVIVGLIIFSPHFLKLIN